MSPPRRPPAAPYGPTKPAEDDIRRVVEQARELAKLIPLGPPGLPSFEPWTLLPLPEVFDKPIEAIDAAYSTLASQGQPLSRTLSDLDWRGNDAERFREAFASIRHSELGARARELRQLGNALRKIQRDTRDEWEWIKLIRWRVESFLREVRRAFDQARSLAFNKLDDAMRAIDHTSDALGHHAESVYEGARALGEAVTPGGSDGSDRLRKASKAADQAGEDARRAYDAVVDFATGWPYRLGCLPDGVCREWYDVDRFMASKSGTSEAYGVVYEAAPFAARIARIARQRAGVPT